MNIFVSNITTIMETMKIIDNNSLQIALVVDEKCHLLGTVTDGDIRRGILKGVGFNEPVSKIMKNNPVTASIKDKRDDLIRIMKEKEVLQLPILNDSNKVVGVEIFGDLVKEKKYDNWVVLMAGGLGSRLSPITDDCPKPMVKVGGKPVLETIIESLIEYGFSRLYFSVNYLKEQIIDYFGDGSKWGAQIIYLIENKRMGTAGAISLLKEQPSKPIIVMNGDLLTRINFKHLLNFHSEHNAVSTMCVREYSFQIPFGVVKIQDHNVREIDEKPTHKIFVNAGVYVLEPNVLEKIPHNQYYDMTILFEKLIKEKKNVVSFPIREYWIDIGYKKDFDKANHDYEDYFNNGRINGE